MKKIILALVWLVLLVLAILDYFSTTPDGGHWYGWYLMAVLVTWGLYKFESTFGTPDFQFPSRDIIYADMQKWIQNNYDAGRTVFLGGYAMGKAQELTKIVTKLCEIPVVVHDKVYANNVIYEKHGTKLGDFFSTSSEEGKELMKDNFVSIVPMHLVNHKFLDCMKRELW